ncbi:unnamed protein product [Gongylonema pulchrum]|uniref:TPR_REGION domain-containing protein n=1 Tax=Gongylonema pulchrum TaxID=637853 RepID=A0A183CX64_9BILA|nr:unnamed protein product [Gongylonema pulchrum]
MLQCLHKAMELDANNPELHVVAAKYLHYLAEVNIFLDQSSVDVTKNWLLRSLDDNKLAGITLRNVEAFYNGVLYGRYGNWTADEMTQLTKRCHYLFKEATLFGGGIDSQEKENNNVKQ